MLAILCELKGGHWVGPKSWHEPVVGVNEAQKCSKLVVGGWLWKVQNNLNFVWHLNYTVLPGMRDPESIRAASVTLIGEIHRWGTDKATFYELFTYSGSAMFPGRFTYLSSNDFANKQFCYISEHLTFHLHRKTFCTFDINQCLQLDKRVLW